MSSPPASMPSLISSQLSKESFPQHIGPEAVSARVSWAQQSITVENMSRWRPSTLLRCCQSRKPAISLPHPLEPFGASSAMLSSETSCARHHMCATAVVSRSILPRSRGTRMCWKPLQRALTTPVPKRSMESIKARRNVSAMDSSSPRNSPSCTGSVRRSCRKRLRSVGLSFTTPVATQKARPWPTEQSRISETRLVSSLPCSSSRNRGCRGTKNGTQQVVASLAPRAPPTSAAKRCDMLAVSLPLSTSLVPGSLHSAMGVAPLLFLMPGSARCRSNSNANGRRPITATMCNGVQPAESIASSGTPQRTSSCTIELLPLRQAVWSRLVPWESQAPGLVPMAMSHRTAERFAVPAKRKASWSSNGSPSNVSLKTVPAGSQSGPLPSTCERPSSLTQSSLDERPSSLVQR
mmetsp:Transcript_30230/g.96548  ORF Transcript_30230/g.96548 Transcript_30230/m.96548 type:complete len:408 (+) Transcript_30230:1125-2348(+)